MHDGLEEGLRSIREVFLGHGQKSGMMHQKPCLRGSPNSIEFTTLTNDLDLTDYSLTYQLTKLHILHVRCKSSDVAISVHTVDCCK